MVILMTWLSGSYFCAWTIRGNLIASRNLFSSRPMEYHFSLRELHAQNSSAVQPCTWIPYCMYACVSDKVKKKEKKDLHLFYIIHACIYGHLVSTYLLRWNGSFAYVQYNVRIHIGEIDDVFAKALLVWLFILQHHLQTLGPGQRALEFKFCYI